MLEEFRCHRLRTPWTMRGQFKRNLQHILAEQGHQRGAIRLFQASAGRQWRTAVKDADIVQTEKATFEDIAPVCDPFGSPTR